MILIDSPLWPARGRVWSHMISDVSYAELHAFAADLGVPRRAFDRDHYDVPGELYALALGSGAAPVGCQELVARLTAAGLRRRRRRRSDAQQGELGAQVGAGALLEPGDGLGRVEQGG